MPAPRRSRGSDLEAWCCGPGPQTERGDQTSKANDTLRGYHGVRHWEQWQALLGRDPRSGARHLVIKLYEVARDVGVSRACYDEEPLLGAV